jgi:two-component system LytT family response regulator
MPDVLRIVVVESSRTERKALRALIDSFRDARIVGEASTGRDAMAVIGRAKPHLALLEVRRQRFDGLELVRRLPREGRPLVAFMSRSEECALEAFELGAVHYVLKPVQPERFREILDRAHERLGSDSGSAGPKDDASAPRPNGDRFAIRVGHDILLLALDQIASIVAEGEILHLTTVRNERHLVTSLSLKQVEARLGSGRFVRLSRGALVNLRSIAKLTPLAGGSYVATLSNGQELVASRSRTRVLRQSLLLR